MMNTLSWMIYLADVADSLGNTLSSALAIALFIAAIRLFWGAIFSMAEEDAVPLHSATKQVVKPLLWCAIPLALILAVIPKSGTIYAIAASEMGEAAFKSDTGSKAVQALNAWLDRQIAGDAE